MVFSSTIFLFIFLPLVLGGNFLFNKNYRNFFLLFSSLIFYAWGEGILVILMITSIALNYLAGIGIGYFKAKPLLAKSVLALSIILNLSLLVYYKYFGFIIENLSLIGFEASVNIDDITLPIGISFFTFQSISYLVDCYRGETSIQKNPFHLGLYIALFPQLIAGPIVRYHDIAKQITKRTINIDLFSNGLIRFIRGLAKKIIIANTAGLITDKVFAVEVENIPPSIAWLGIICYALQIYFDFSGYSDMAIGLGRMMGFKFLENFNYPYISQSIQEFWRRWHISLSTWFRDYLYIPLGGNRVGGVRTYVNLFIVFFITGLWHGASWSFIIWGLFHGVFLILERSRIINLNKLPVFLRHIYVLLIVLFGWVFFRAENLSYALTYISNMLFINSAGIDYTPVLYLSNLNIFILLIGLVFSTPLRKYIFELMKLKFALPRTLDIAQLIFYISILIIAILELAQASYNPFIYFRF